MITNTLDGDLLSLFGLGRFDAIVQGCNCYHLMGAGIAGQIADLYPAAFDADLLTPVGPAKLGTYSKTFIPGKGTIINLYTQDRPGRESHAVLHATLSQGFKLINDNRAEFAGRRPVIGIPQIGAGIAGGDWDAHAEIINLVTPNVDIVLVNYKPAAAVFVPATKDHLLA